MTTLKYINKIDPVTLVQIVKANLKNYTRLHRTVVFNLLEEEKQRYAEEQYPIESKQAQETMTKKNKP